MLCGTATVTVTASGGTAPYRGTGTFTRDAGTYSFVVTDAKGCTAVTTMYYFSAIAIGSNSRCTSDTM
ncbi:MAG: hypothetical protein WDO16_06080 [Bacteroidota bacterium]